MNLDHPAQTEQQSTRNFWLALLVVSLFNAVVLIHFHDRFWWPPDEGVYAHTAERMLNGEVLNKDVEEIHTGYTHFIHMASFAAFGTRLVSMRYPLIAAGFLQSLLMLLIFAPRNLMIAVAAAVCATAFGVIQFLNPQPSWYCLLFMTGIAFVLTRMRAWKWTIQLVGFLIGLIFFFRQITGVFAAMGVLLYLLTERKEESSGQRTWMARGLIALMLVGTVGYLLRASNGSGWILIGIWPVFLLGESVLRPAKTSNKTSVEIVAKLAIGFVVSALPIVVYHIAHRSLNTFFDDTVLRALDIQQLPYLKLANFLAQQRYAARTLVQFRSFHEAINGFFWLVLPLSTVVTGALVVKRFAKSRSSADVGPLPVLAVFYALVALFQQIPIYFFYMLPMTTGALFWLFLNGKKRAVLIFATVALVFSSIAIYYQAAQPVTRSLAGIIRGERVALVPATSIKRAGLWVEPESLKIYTALIGAIQLNSQPNETIFVLPYNPELYFLAERRNPFRFWNTAVGIRPGREEQQVMNLLRTSPPRVVVIAPRDRNNTPISETIIGYVRANHSLVETIGSFEVYRAP
ncbi:MAG TPA: hypothetical protein VHQ94_07465 [Pyrinomonadaceae bacterium]|nr:hypothetical protein [Pyrinomonadaceae bacterium]